MKPENKIFAQDFQALAEFRYHIRRFVHFSEQQARAIGLEPQQHQVLLIVKGMPQGKSATIGDIAERLQIQHHSAVELVDRLMEHGFVARHRDEADHRRVLVELTSQGEAILQQLSSAMVEELKITGPSLVQTLSLLLNAST